MGNLNKIDIRPYINKATKTRLGVDYLRLNFKFGITHLDQIIKKINTTNSNTYFDDEYTYLNTQTPMGKALQIIYTWNGQSIPIMLYAELNQNLRNPLAKVKKDIPFARLDFYGSFFRLQEIGELKHSFIEDYISQHSQEDPTITRIDYCVDLFYDTKQASIIPTTELLPGIREDSQNFHHYFGGKENSWSIGESKNKRYVIRMYDKLIDTLGKKKYGLYGDYFNYKSVHRYEVEFNNGFCAGYTLNRFDFLLSKVKTYMKLSNEFNGVMFYSYNGKYEINEFNKTYLAKVFVGKAKKFTLAGFNPYKMIYSAFIQDQEITKNIHFDMIDEFLDILPLKKF